MKYLIPTGALLALAICGLIRPEAMDATPVRRAQDPIVEAPVTSGIAEACRDVGPSEQPAEIVRTAVSVDPRPVLTAPAPDIVEMFQTLKLRLELTPAQEAPVAEALRARAKELQECQEAHRKKGVFVPREYGNQLIRMKEAWYRRIDGVLNTEQHRMFAGLVAEGFFRPGTEFSVDLMTMSVIR